MVFRGLHGARLAPRRELPFRQELPLALTLGLRHLVCGGWGRIAPRKAGRGSAGRRSRQIFRSKGLRPAAQITMRRGTTPFKSGLFKSWAQSAPFTGGPQGDRRSARRAGCILGAAGGEAARRGTERRKILSCLIG